MSVCLLIIDDGREDYLARSVESASEMLPEVGHKVIVDDAEHSLGFAGAVQEGWNRVLETGADWVFHLESDFVFNQPVPLARMQCLLDVADQPGHNRLAQVSLKRQPWNQREKAAGGIVEADLDDFSWRSNGMDDWTEHRRYFTTNPSLYRAALCERGWPQVPESEGVFTHQLLADGYRFAIWGKPLAPPMVEHIGRERAGKGY